MPGPHVTAWAAKSLAGEPVSVVRVRNLQAVTSTGRDAWGRVGKPQPLLVSAELSFRQPFSQASAEDRLGTDTVNYGSLSKAILKCLERARPRAPDPEVGLRFVLDDLWFALTGLVVGKCPHEPVVRETFWDSTDGVLLLDLSVLKSMSITLMLPKASLLGEGVSLTASSIFGLKGEGAVVDAYSTTLRLHRLRVPTLIGVNANERLAKQVVVADIELDKVYPRNDIYTFVEDLVVKVCLLSHPRVASPNHNLDNGGIIL